MIDLDRELDVAIAQFNRAGLSLLDDLCLYVSVGVQGIETDGDLYQPIDHGPLAAVMGVYAGPTPSFATPVYEDDSGLVDLVAFRVSEPRWWLRSGGGLYLNARLIRAAVTWQKPLDVFATPLAWLNGRGRGVCPLTSDYEALRDPNELRFEDAEFAASVRRVLSRPSRLPKFMVSA